MKKARIAVLVSGGGTNLQALIDAQLRGELGGGEIVAVISSKDGAYALERGAKVTGATVHFVDEGTDTGPILLQKPVMVQPEDTPESLQKRVMVEAEWEILPAAINAIANGKVTWQDGKAFVTE